MSRDDDLEDALDIYRRRHDPPDFKNFQRVLRAVMEVEGMMVCDKCNLSKRHHIILALLDRRPDHTFELAEYRQ